MVSSLFYRMDIGFPLLLTSSGPILTANKTTCFRRLELASPLVPERHSLFKVHVLHASIPMLPAAQPRSLLPGKIGLRFRVVSDPSRLTRFDLSPLRYNSNLPYDLSVAGVCEIGCSGASYLHNGICSKCADPNAVVCSTSATTTWSVGILLLGFLGALLCRVNE